MDKNLISNKIEQAISEGIFPGAVLLCSLNQDIVFYESFGMADVFKKRKMGKEHIFDLASLTKPLATTLAISRLIEKGQIFLNQKTGSIIKKFIGSDKADITIDMLLRHTSGLPSYKEYYKKIIKNHEDPVKYLRQLIVNEPLENRPGVNQVYSDLGFMVLSWIIEKTSNQRLDNFVLNQIYYPLKIKDLFFIDLKLKNEKLKNYKNRIVSTQNCLWRKKVLTGEVDDDNAWAAGGIEGHAGLFGNAVSIHALCCEILNALQDKPVKILSTDIIKAFVQKKNDDDMVAGFDTPSKENSSAGRYFSGLSLGHLGFTGTSFWIDPEKSLIVVLLTNRVHPLRSNKGIKKFRIAIHDLIYTQI